MEKNKKAFLIDAYNIIFRSYYAIKQINNKEGVPVNALYGYLNIILKIINNNNIRDDIFIVAADTGQKNFRHEIYSDYKANRKHADKELIIQFPLIEEATKKLGLQYVSKKGFEADDIIASISEELRKKDIEIIIVSSDKDLYQLISNKIKLMDPVSMKTVEEKDVIEKTGVMPRQIPDLLALQGDSSDNIPGVNGIGPKTAAKILNEVSCVENILSKDFNITDEKILKHIRKINEEVIKFKELTTLKKDIKIDQSYISGLVQQDLSENQEFKNFLEIHGFNSILSRIYTNISKKNKTKDDLTKGYAKASPESFIKNIINDDGILKIDINEEEEIIIKNSYNEVIKSKNKETLDPLILNALKDESIIKITDNSEKILNEIDKIEPIHDLKIMNYAISTLSVDQSNNSIEDFKQLRKKIILNKTFNIYELIDRPMIKILHKMQAEGVKIDLSALDKVKQNLSIRLSEIEKKIFELSKATFNIASNKQLSEILLTKFGLSLRKKQKTQNYVIDVSVLEDLESAGVEVASLILQWRKINKIITTYADGLKKYVKEKNSKIHTTYNLTGTSTGRISSNNPNMQNIPIKTAEGREIRRAIIASEDSVLLSADYSQIELRILAHIANETTMIDQLNCDEDIHEITAKQIFPDLEKSQSRRMAKTVNFGIIYGISPFGLSKQLGISHLSSKIIIDKYFNKYKKISQYLTSTIEFARDQGYVKTIFGRKCKIDGLLSSNIQLRKFAERSAINAPIQGSAADIVKIAMKKIDEFLEKKKLKSKLIMQIHDEIIIDANKKEVDYLSDIIKGIMENSAKIKVPMKVNIKTGSNMLELK